MPPRLRLSSSLSFLYPRHAHLKISPRLAKQIPPASPSNPSQRRQFSASSHSRFLEPVLEFSHASFQAIHSTTGLPWALSIPATAICVRVLLFPIAIYLRKMEQRQLALMPLLKAWMFQISRKQQSQANTHVLHGIPNAKTLKIRVTKAMAIKTRELMKRNGCSPLKRIAIGVGIQFPVFLIVMETLRRMAGKGVGLLGLGADGLKAFGTWIGLNAEGRVILADDDPSYVTDVPAAIVADPVARIQEIVPMELSFMDEGMLWFPDLLAADPELYLPLLLSVSLLVNLRQSGSRIKNATTQAAVDASDKSSSSAQTGMALTTEGRSPKLAGTMRKALMFFSLMAFPLTLQMPAALLIYWISSSWLAFLQYAILDRFVPLKKEFKGFRGEALAHEASIRAKAEAKAQKKAQT